MDLQTRAEMKRLLNNQEKLNKYIKDHKLVQIEISYVFENMGEQIGLVSFFVPEEAGLELSRIINPEYRPYRIYVRVGEEKVCFVELEGGPISYAHYKRDEKLEEFERKLKSFSLGITFKQLPI